jgi:hypothetical protein
VFLSFYIVQLVSMVREAIAFLSVCSIWIWHVGPPRANRKIRGPFTCVDSGNIDPIL